MNIRLLEQHDLEVVLALWQEACIEAVGHPLPEDSAKRVLDMLGRYITHEECHCFVAETDTKIVGFVACVVLDHPVQSGYVGQIEELFVQPDQDRPAIQTELVKQAVIQLKRQGVGMIYTLIDVEEPAQMAFWKQLNWSPDMMRFSVYSNVPADPDLQAVWDSYQG